MDVGDKVNDERVAFEAWAKPQPYWWNGQTYSDLHTQVAWEAWQAARRTPSASTGEDGLPELPWGDDFEAWLEVRTEHEASAAVRQYAREAVAADRRARQSNENLMAELVAASDAVVERWHSRDWKQPHTAEFIARLTAAIGAIK